MRQTTWTAERSVEPAEAPVTLADAKAQCRVGDDITVDDALLDAYAFAAAETVEKMTARALLTQTWVYTADGFPCDGEPIVLPRPPLQDIISVQYRDSNGDLQTWDASNYREAIVGKFGALVANVGVGYPDTACVPDAVTITYVCGYDAVDDVPARFMVAQQMLIAHWYAKREIDGAQGLGLEHLVGTPANPDPCW